MREFFCLTALIFFMPLSSFGQANTWTWIKGSQNVIQNGVYGTKGVPASANIPPARYQSCYWTDKAGNLWLFGGVKGNTGLPPFYFNDTWKFDMSIKEWVWMTGPQLDNNPFGSLGTKGVPSASNIPPGCSFGANCWQDTADNFYMMGGSGRCRGDVLWKYSVANNTWTWIAGSSTTTAAVYGTKGVASATNTPGLRRESKAGFYFDNKLWLFGGQNHIDAAVNDVWSFDLSTLEWTWEAGSTASNAIGNYGSKGVPAMANEPPGNWNYSSWFSTDNKFYLFGGLKKYAGVDVYNHLWIFDPVTKMWTWVGGSNTLDDVGSVGPSCNFLNSNTPRARFENSTASFQKPCQDVFYLFGGMGDGGTYMNDVWVLNPTTYEWSILYGNNLPSTTSNYGTQGVANAGNEPPSRAGAAIWTDKEGNIWLFGGMKNSQLTARNDLWKFTVDTLCTPSLDTTLQLQWPGDSIICRGDSIVFPLGAGLQVEIDPMDNSYYNLSTNEIILKPISTTTYAIKASTSLKPNCNLSDSTVLTIIVNPQPTAVMNTIKLGGENDYHYQFENQSIDYDSFTWYYNGKRLNYSGNILDTTFFEKGTHCISLTTTNSCGTDSVFNCVIVEDDFFIPNSFTPNSDGTNDIFRIVNPGLLQLNYLRIYNRWGQMIFATNDILNGWDGNFRGTPCEIGTYYYIFSIKNREESIYGDLTLLR